MWHLFLICYFDAFVIIIIIIIHILGHRACISSMEIYYFLADLHFYWLQLTLADLLFQRIYWENGVGPDSWQVPKSLVCLGPA